MCHDTKTRLPVYNFSYNMGQLKDFRNKPHNVDCDIYIDMI